MVAMVSPTTLLPGKTLAMVPGDKDLARSAPAGSNLNSGRREHRAMQQAAGILSSLPECTLCWTEGLCRYLEKRCSKAEAALESGIHCTARRKLTFIIMRRPAKCYAEHVCVLVKALSQAGHGLRGTSWRWMTRTHLGAHVCLIG